MLCCYMDNINITPKKCFAQLEEHYTSIVIPCYSSLVNIRRQGESACINHNFLQLSEMEIPLLIPNSPSTAVFGYKIR